MNANWTSKRVTVLVGLLSAIMLLGGASSAQAEQGKWWNPKEGGQRPARREAYRAPARHDSYRAPTWRAPRYVGPGQRYSRSWRGYRVYRDRVWVGPGWGYHGRPAYGWRYYRAPVYYYPQRTCYVRPLRFFISAGAVIGGVSVHAEYADPGDLYGCNFCDARFTSYHAYEAHVAHCSHAPDGYRVVAHDWDSGAWDNSGGRDEQNWSYEDED